MKGEKKSPADSRLQGWFFMWWTMVLWKTEIATQGALRPYRGAPLGESSGTNNWYPDRIANLVHVVSPDTLKIYTKAHGAKVRMIVRWTKKGPG